MKTTLFAALFTIIIGVQNQSRLPGYRGIVPLKSTRADVERILGQPAKDSAYHFPGKTVYIQYSKYGCEPPPNVEGWPKPPIEGWNVPLDTVLVIRVNLRRQSPLKDFGFDLKPFEKGPGDHDVPSHFVYRNKESGLSIDLNGDGGTEIVWALIYGPEAKYGHLACSE